MNPISASAAQPQHSLYLAMPVELRNNVINMIASHASGRTSVADLQNAMLALPGLKEYVSRTPVLRNYLQHQSELVQAQADGRQHLQALGLIDTNAVMAHLRGNGEATAAQQQALAELLEQGNLSKLPEADQALLVNRASGSSPAQATLLQFLCSKLSQLAPALQRDVAHAALQSPHAQTHQLHAQLLPHFARLNPSQQQRLFDAVMQHPGSETLKGLAGIAVHLNSRQKNSVAEQAFSSNNVLPLAAGIMHFPKETSDAFFTFMLRRAGTISSTLREMGDDVARIDPQTLQQLLTKMDILPENHQLLLYSALAPLADSLPGELHQQLLPAIADYPDETIGSRLMAPLCRHITHFTADQQQSLVDSALALSTESFADPQMFTELGSHFMRLGDDQQQALLDKLPHSQEHIQIALVDGIGSALAKAGGPDADDLPWQALIDVVADRLTPGDERDATLQKLSDHLNQMLAHYLAA